MGQHVIEINSDAVAELSRVILSVNINHKSIVKYLPHRIFDLVLIRGLLIHINFDSLLQVYEKLHTSSGRHMLVKEYYNLEPVVVSYRNHENRLLKRDFAGEILDIYSDMTLLDYCFVYRRDTKFPLDDSAWFLLEKKGFVSV